jgi:uncharacterized RmlC-like cupin family protein
MSQPADPAPQTSGPARSLVNLEGTGGAPTDPAAPFGCALADQAQAGASGQAVPAAPADPAAAAAAAAAADDDLARRVDGGDGIFVIRGSATHRDWNGIRYKTGLSAKNVAAKHLSMNVATIPPGGVAYAHIHVDFEVMLYILVGRVRHEYGPNLALSIDNEAGDFIFIQPGIPHEVKNLSDSEPVVAVVARSDASEWENIIPYPRRPA